MSVPQRRFKTMSNMKLPKTPAQAYREATADVAAYRAGVALRIIWEVAKPILKWTAIIAVLSFVWMLYLIWHLVFGTMRK